MSEGPIDFHTHVQPDADFGIAFQRRFGFEEPAFDGTPRELLPLMHEAGVRRVLMVPWLPGQDVVDERVAANATAAAREAARHQVVAEWSLLNRWAVDTVAQHPDRLSCLVGLDPLLMTRAELVSEIEDKLGRGACGLKIAPMFARATPDDERVAILFEQAERHGVFVLSQAGAHGYAGRPSWGHPRHFEEVLRSWPGVDVQLAHLGLGAEDEVARLTAKYPNLFADTSARLQEVDQPGGWSAAETVEWFRRIGVDRVLFGTNYPMHDPRHFIEVMGRLPLTDDEREQILWRNAEGILARSASPA